MIRHPLALLLACLLSMATAHADGGVRLDNTNFDAFGAIDVLHPAGAAGGIILLLADRPGRADHDLAAALAARGELVALVRPHRFLADAAKNHATCIDPVTLLDLLSQHLQAQYRFATYRRPTLVGVGPAAALAHNALLQAPNRLFGAGIGIAPEPELALPAPPCGGAWQPSAPGRYRFDLDRAPATPWRQLPVADAGTVATALAGLAESNLAGPDGVDDLPLLELPPAVAGADYFAVLLSGDGGWANIDKDIGALLAARGVPVVGWNSLQYFWTRKTPAQTGADLGRVLRHYRARWGKSRALVIGYSLGANVLPFMLNRLPAPQRADVAGVALLSLWPEVDFEFHVSDWLGSAADRSLPVAPELAGLAGLPVLCLYGADDDQALCRQPGLPAGIEARELPGDHHFDGDSAKVADLILDRLGTAAGHGAPVDGHRPDRSI